MSKLCNFYVEVKDMDDDSAKVFNCNCKRHKGRDISVVKFDNQIREIRL